MKAATQDEMVSRIQKAERAVAHAREGIVLRGWVSSYEELDPAFIVALDEMFIAVRDAVRGAEKKEDAPFLRRLLPVLDGVTRLIQARRAIESDRVNHPAAKLNRFMQMLDQTIPAIQRLDVAPRPPLIQSPRAMTADGCGLSAVMAVWKHLGVVLVEQVCRGMADDIPGERHPEYIVWQEKQKIMPDFDDSILHGECRTIDRNRERGNVPAVV